MPTRRPEQKQRLTQRAEFTSLKNCKCPGGISGHFLFLRQPHDDSFPVGAELLVGFGKLLGLGFGVVGEADLPGVGDSVNKTGAVFRWFQSFSRNGMGSDKACWIEVTVFQGLVVRQNDSKNVSPGWFEGDPFFGLRLPVFHLLEVIDEADALLGEKIPGPEAVFWGFFGILFDKSEGFIEPADGNFLGDLLQGFGPIQNYFFGWSGLQALFDSEKVGLSCTDVVAEPAFEMQFLLSCMKSSYLFCSNSRGSDRREIQDFGVGLGVFQIESGNGLVDFEPFKILFQWEGLNLLQKGNGVLPLSLFPHFQGEGQSPHAINDVFKVLGELLDGGGLRAPKNHGDLKEGALYVITVFVRFEVGDEFCGVAFGTLAPGVEVG